MFNPAEALKKTKELKQKDANSIILDETKGTLLGSMVGGGIGLMFAYSRKKSFVVYGFLGVLAGGLLSRLIINQKEKS